MREALQVLLATDQIEKTPRGLRPKQVLVIETGQDPVRAAALKAAWLRTALARLESGSPGRFGYSLFAASRADLARLHDVHLQYVRAMQDIVASSTPSECVGLYCAQLLDLSAE